MKVEEKAAAEKAAAEKREQDRLRKLAKELLGRVDEKKNVTDCRESVVETATLESKRQTLRNPLGAVTLTEGAIDEVNLGHLADRHQLQHVDAQPGSTVATQETAPIRRA